MSDQMIVVGRILKPFGILGEVVVIPTGDDPQRFAPGESFFLDPEGEQRITVESLRAGGGIFRVRFLEYPDRHAVESVIGSTLYRDANELPELPEGRYYHFQLVGLRVTRADGAELGKVVRVLDLRGGDVYEVDGEKDGWMIPAGPEFVAWKDLERGEIRLQDRDDLLEAVAKPKSPKGLLPRERKRILRRRSREANRKKEIETNERAGDRPMKTDPTSESD